MLNITNHRDRAAAQEQKGSVLLEGLIAVLVFSFGILAIVGMQASTMKATTLAKSRIDASMIANERIGKMWVDQSNLSAYVETNTSLSTLLSGKRTTTVNGDEVTVVVKWKVPGDNTEHSFQTIARVNTNPSPP